MTTDMMDAAEVAEQPTIDRLRDELKAANLELSELKQRVIALPRQLDAAAAEAARTDDLGEVLRLQAVERVLPHKIKIAAARVESLTCAVEDWEIEEAHAQMVASLPAVEETRLALERAQEAHSAATAIHNSAYYRQQALSENSRRRRAGIG